MVSLTKSAGSGMAVAAPDRGRRFLACMGDPNDPDTWSSTPYHFLKAGVRLGLLDEGLPLVTAKRDVKLRRWVWNAIQVATLGGRGGYQMSVGFLERLWRPWHEQLQGHAVINHYQFYPPSIVADPLIEKWYYIDGTIRQVIDLYNDRAGRRIQQEAIRREREGYQSAAGVVAMSRYAADSVVRDYGVDPSRVHVVVPGANLTLEEYEQALADQPLREKRGPLRLVFVGKDWRRKGLDRLLGAMAIGRSKGLSATLRVIGCAPETVPPELRQLDGVEWVGFVPRRTDARRLFRLVSECDVGCLLSRAEFSSIALREFLALGLAVVGTASGGCGDLVVPSASIVVQPSSSDEEIAEILLDLQRPGRVDQLRAAAREASPTALWEESARRFAKIMDPRHPASSAVR